MRVFNYLTFILIALFGVTFAALNASNVTINYYIATTELPLPLLVIVVFCIGCIIGIITSIAIFIKAKREIFSLKKALKNKEKELQNIRTMPLRDQP